MTNTKRRRGRPPGPNAADRVTLEAAADMMLAEPSLKRATAMKRIVGDNPSVLRRLHRHWVVMGAQLQEGARQRAAARASSPTRREPARQSGRESRGVAYSDPLANTKKLIAAAFEQGALMKELADPPAVRALREAAAKYSAFSAAVDTVTQQATTVERLHEAAMRAATLYPTFEEPPELRNARATREVIERLVRGLG